MYRIIATFYLFAIVFTHEIIAQSNDLPKDGKTDVYLYLLSSYEIDGRVNEWSKLGGGVDVEWRQKNNWTIGLRTNVRYWSQRDELLLPLNIGPGHILRLGSSASLLLQLGVGTHLTIGNDYAGFFGHASGGVKLNVFNIGKIGLFTGINFAQGAIFHPDQFTYFDFIFGIRL